MRLFHELSPRLPDDAIVTADSGSAANWYARHLTMRGDMRGSLSGNAGDDGPGRAVRDRREVRVSRPAGDRPRRRRRDADERHRRADHDRAVLAAVERPAARRRRAAQQRPQPGHLGDAGDGGAPKFVGRRPCPTSPTPASPRSLGLQGSVSTSPRTSGRLGRACPPAGRPCWSPSPIRRCRRYRRTSRLEQVEATAAAMSRATPAAGGGQQGIKAKVQQFLPGVKGERLRRVRQSRNRMREIPATGGPSGCARRTPDRGDSALPLGAEICVDHYGAVRQQWMWTPVVLLAPADRRAGVAGGRSPSARPGPCCRSRGRSSSSTGWRASSSTARGSRASPEACEPSYNLVMGPPALAPRW